MRLLSWALFIAASLSPAACSSNCDQTNLCSVTGDEDSLQVCDGTSFKLCSAANRGEVVNCPAVGQRATCTPSGWVFDQIGVTDMM